MSEQHAPPPPPAAELPVRAVRALGIALLLAAITVPVVMLWLHGQNRPEEGKVRHLGDLRPEMVVLPAAETFLMGSPDTEEGRDEDEAQREVRIARPFAVAVTEVTRAQYEAVMGVPAHEGCVVESEGQQVPAVCVTWFEAVRFANRLSTIEGLTPVYEIVGSSVTWKPTPSRKVGYRLLTEREWEYAARAETQTVFVGTSDPTGACDWANVSDRSRGGSFLCDDGFPRLAPVENRMRPNVWRLAGFGGNAAEWVWDWYAEKPPDAARGPETGQSRVFRGGSWYDSPQSARVADRGRNGPSARYSLVGFRLARSCHPSAVSPSKCFAPQAE